ncbi:hypothetical protein, partial [Mycoplasma elephantis]|uniref:hypothetical protein n=1 Tax=Mycoplasma elephantis TaxID=114882 RepID=UPI000560D4F8
TFKDKLLDKINEELAGNFDAYTSTSKDAYKKYLNDLKNLVNSPDFTNNETTYNEKLNEITEKKKLLEENKVNELKKFIEDSKKSVESNKSLPASEKEKLTKYLNEYNVPTDVNNSDLQTKKKEIQDKLAKATTFKDLLLEKIKSEENENYDKYTSTSKTNYLNYLSDLKTKVNDSSFTNNEMIYNKKLNEITKNKKLLILYTNEFIIKDVKDAKDKINTLKSKYSSSSIKDVIKKIDELQNNVKNNGIDNKDQYDKKVKELDNLLDQLQSEPQRSFDWKFWLLILGWSALTLEVIIILSILIKAKK